MKNVDCNIEKMNEKSYNTIKRDMIKNLAETFIQTKKANELTAISLAEKELNGILTEGVKTKNHNLYVVSVILIAGIGGLTISFGTVTLTEVACALILGIITNKMLSYKHI